MSTTLSRSDALVERLFGATIGALELYSVYLGVELGLYRALAEDGPLTPGELAERAGIAPRYAREWLEQQAVAGLLDADGTHNGERRRYRLDAEHARVLAEPEDAAHVAPFAHMLVGIGRVLPDVAAAYRSGGGVPFEAYGQEMRHGQGHINRPAFTHDLPTSWIAALPDVVARLESGEGTRVADIGCGQGWASIGIARVFPGAHVDGIDLDESSIADARRHAAEAGVDERVRFLHGDASLLAGEGPYDLVLILEVLHDLSRPVEVLRAAREALAPGGTLLVADERVADRFAAPGDEIERMMYGWSVVHCLPTSLVDEPSAAIGTVMRTDTLRKLATEAGFDRVEVLPIENDLFRFYRLDAS
jgi:2-polyprenyl-3-methyl-5-hydroxy-6-metoxy-1,4-benzoquinol methylase